MLRRSSHLTFGIGLLIVFNFLSWAVLSMTIPLILSNLSELQVRVN